MGASTLGQARREPAPRVNTSLTRVLHELQQMSTAPTAVPQRAGIGRASTDGVMAAASRRLEVLRPTYPICTVGSKQIFAARLAAIAVGIAALVAGVWAIEGVISERDEPATTQVAPDDHVAPVDEPVATMHEVTPPAPEQPRERKPAKAAAKRMAVKPVKKPAAPRTTKRRAWDPDQLFAK